MRERKEWIDIAKGIGIILVIFGHSYVNNKIVYGFHMPLFFIISGYLFDFEKWNKKGLAIFFETKFKKYIIPYIVLCIVNILLLVRYEPKDNLPKTITKQLFWSLYSKSRTDYMPNCSPLWFLPCLFLCLIFLYLVLKIRNRFIRGLVVIFGIILDYLIIYLNIPQLPWHIDTALIGTSFMLIGYGIKRKRLLTDNKLGLPIVVLLFAIGLAAIIMNGYVLFAENRYSNFVLMFIGGTFLSYVILWICKILPTIKPISRFGRGTVIVMGFNYFFNFVTHYYWDNNPLSHYMSYSWWIQFIMVIVECYMTIFLWDCFKKIFCKMVNKFKTKE